VDEGHVVTQHCVGLNRVSVRVSSMRVYAQEHPSPPRGLRG